MISLLLPALLVCTSSVALIRKVDVFDAMTSGIYQGVKTIMNIFPSLIALLVAVSMLRASGFIDFISNLSAPLFDFFGIPSQLAPLVFIRPVSGSAALAVCTDIITAYGADSIISRTAAVMMASTETTFYVIGLYAGTASVKKCGHILPAALAADFVGFIVSSVTVQLFWG